MNRVDFSLLLPPRLANSPRMDVPERRVVGAMPAGDKHATTRMVDDAGGFTFVPQTVVEVVLDGQSLRVETREAAIELITDYYAAQHDDPAQEES